LHDNELIKDYNFCIQFLNFRPRILSLE
jgi:hypothetical protein